jgi:DNA-binding MarR family transcriptional regulator
MTRGSDIVRLLQSLIRVEVDQFDAVDARLRADSGVLLIELMPLRVIAGAADCRVQDLADGLGISVGGASKSVDRLEARGWLRRVPHPGDRRSSILRLTDAGERVREEGDRIAAEVLRARLAEVLGGDLPTLDELLARLDPTRSGHGDRIGPEH